MPITQNFYSTVLAPQPGTGQYRYLYKRPTEVLWQLLNINFRPHDGQNVRIRERYQVTIQADGTKTIYTNENRFLSNTNTGYWQHLYLNEIDKYYVEREGQMNVSPIQTGSETYTHTTSYDWDLNIYRQLDDQFAATLTTIKSCNADLRPAAVPNEYIDEANALDYVKLYVKLAGGNFAGALEDIQEFTQPTIPGFRFSETGNLFLGKTQLRSVNLVAKNAAGVPMGKIPTAIGDLGLYVPGGYTVQDCVYSVEVREYGLIGKNPLQIDPIITCGYSDPVDYPFPGQPPNTTCAELLAQQVAANQLFLSAVAAQNYIDNVIFTGTVADPYQYSLQCSDGTVPASTQVWSINLI